MLVFKFIWKKAVATILVLTAFLYFWMNGPLSEKGITINLNEEASEFVRPILVGEERITEEFSTLEIKEEHTFGNRLIIEQKREVTAFKVLNAESNQSLSEEGIKELKQHAGLFYQGSNYPQIQQTEELSYLFYGQADGKLEQLFIETKGNADHVVGYAGPVNIGIELDNEGHLIAVNHIASQETDSYLDKISKKGFYQQFQGINIKASELEIDAVSGATITSIAIAQSISETIQKASANAFSTYYDTGNNDFSVLATLNFWWIVHLIIIGTLFIYGLQTRWKKSKKGVLIINIISMLYIGFFLNSSFTYVSFIHPFIGTNISTFTGIYALFVLMGSIWGKNTYCKYVCPFGSAQRLTNKLLPKKQKKFFLPNQWVSRIRDAITLTLIVGVLIGMRHWSNFELFPDLFGLNFTNYWIIASLLTLLISLRYPLLWCRLLCPTGAVLDNISEIVKSRSHLKNTISRHPRFDRGSPNRVISMFKGIPIFIGMKKVNFEMAPNTSGNAYQSLIALFLKKLQLR